jgi:hypothetical protein
MEKIENDNLKDKQTSAAIEAFFCQFGTFDIYTQIVLEEFFKELLDEKHAIHIPSETR